MSRIASCYDNTIIYKICCKNVNIKDEYIGHTKNLIRRRSEHKSNSNNEKGEKYNLKLYKHIRENGGWVNWTLVQIEAYPCNNINEARARERYYIELLKPSLNCDIPNRTSKEYRIDNKKKICERDKNYRKTNKAELAEKSKLYRENNIEKSKIYYKNNIERSKIYYQTNKEKIRERKINYRQDNKVEIREKFKIYYESNKAKLAEKNKIYRDSNKDIIYEKITCECGCKISRKHISEHKKSKKHLNKLNSSHIIEDDGCTKK